MKPVGKPVLKLDIIEDLLSFYARCVGIALNRDYDKKISEIKLARGTGPASTLLLVAANPGVRPSTLAKVMLKDRSAIGKVLDRLKQDGMMIERTSDEEKRAHELYLTKSGYELAELVRTVAQAQSKQFFDVLTEEEQGTLLVMLKKLYEANSG